MRQIRVRTLIAAGLVLCGFFTGCEGSPDMENVDSYFDGASVDSVANRPPVEAARMQVTPADVTLSSNGSVASFSVEGAIGSVAWSVQDISKGSILTQSRQSATYQRSAAGDNVVIATDSRGNAAFAAVKQP